MHKAWHKPKLKIDVLGTPTQEFLSAFESIVFFLKLIVLVILITYLDWVCLAFLSRKNSLNIRLSICKKTIKKKTNYLPTMKNSKVKIIDISGTYQYTNMIEFFSFVRFGFSFTRKSKGCAEKLCYFFFSRHFCKSAF